MSALTGGRSVLRSIAVGGVLVGTLATASSASAALGGTPAVFANRPNLQSVTFNGSVASFNFDKPVQPAGGGPAANPAAFTIGGYRAGAVNASPATSANIAISDPRTVLVTYGLNTPDFNAATFGAVAGGIVQGLGTFANPNLPDATRLTGSTSESGTRGHTAGPNLQQVIVDQNNNRITYVFDQAVLSNNPNPANFKFVDVNGTVQSGAGGPGAAAVSGSTVTVTFAAPVNTARQAMVYGPTNAGPNGPAVVAPFVTSKDTPGTQLATAESVNVAGAPSSQTSHPMLVSADLEPGTGTVVYTYDQPINQAIPASWFKVTASNGAQFAGTNAIVIGSTVRVTFGGIELFTEHLVLAADTNNAVIGQNTLGNRAAGKPIGGNIGASASGWTTAPDAISATFNPTTGQVSVLFDSRLVPGSVDPTDFRLLDSNGTFIGDAQNSPTIQQNIGGPTQARVVLQYNPLQVQLASVIQIRGGRNTGAGWAYPDGSAVIGTAPLGAASDDANVQTMLVPTTTSTPFAASK